MSETHTPSHTSPGSPGAAVIAILEDRRSWRIEVRLFVAGGFRAEARTSGYGPLAERGPTAAVALARIRATVDAFDELLGRGERGGL